MPHFDLPHDENHRFLAWGPRDGTFNAWCKYFDKKGIQYEIGGAKSRDKDGQEIERWTIYKHQLHVRVDCIGCTRCCPQDEEF